MSSPAAPDERATDTDRQDVDPELPLVVVSVGTDHHRFDRLVGWMDDWARTRRSVRVVIQRGTTPATTSAESQPLIPHAELCDLFAAAQAVVIHGGPSTVMDARAAGRLPIVVARDPELGEHVDGHQLRFARHLADHGLARVVDDRADVEAAVAEALADPERFTIAEAGDAVAPGVAGFARVVDELLGGATVEPSPTEPQRSASALPDTTDRSTTDRSTTDLEMNR